MEAVYRVYSDQGHFYATLNKNISCATASEQVYTAWSELAVFTLIGLEDNKHEEPEITC